LSGIFPENNICNPLLKKDSGEAGMTEVGQGSLSINVAILMNSLVFGMLNKISKYQLMA